MGSASITISPSPPMQCGKVTFTCDGVLPGTKLKLDWDPAGEPNEAEVGSDGTVTVLVPIDAEGLIVTDPVSGVDDATTITPS